jgi:AmmeMemoRadiSam system protein B
VNTSIRMPAVAGRFYPANAEKLLQELEGFLTPDPSPIRAFGCVAPHAGYVYSGSIAGAVYSRIAVPRCCVVLCPNHTGLGPPLSIMSSGDWHTPLGSVPIDEELATELKTRLAQLTEDRDAHRAEHAIEVQLPFLEVRQRFLKFVPIVLGTSRFELLEALGIALAEVCGTRDERPLIVASSDMNHYESDAITRRKDQMAIDRVLALDARGLHDVVMNEDISMCGFGPATAMITAAKNLGATQAELVEYATSGDVSGDRDRVVGYAGIVVI